MKLLRMALLALGCCGLAGASAAAESGDRDKGMQIARAAQERAGGYGSYVAAGKMILRDKTESFNVREFAAKSLEMDGDGDRTEIEFATPLDVRGMALLTHAHTTRDDDQWLYLPAINRVKRITSSSRSGSFAGSEFSYEDLVGHVLEKNDYEYLRDEPCPGNPQRSCHVNVQIPKAADSGYSRLVGWLDAEDYRTYKVEYFDRRGAHIKTMVSTDFRLYKERYWRAHNMVMSNHQTGKSTVMEWARYDFQTPVRAIELEPFTLGKN
ncbi:MAG: outer membrane lipoprotein-sorting protein [Reyranellaceae bacterium]